MGTQDSSQSQNQSRTSSSNQRSTQGRSSYKSQVDGHSALLHTGDTLGDFVHGTYNTSPIQFKQNYIHDRYKHIQVTVTVRFHCIEQVKAKIKVISSDTHQLQCIELHHFKLERFKSI